MDLLKFGLTSNKPTMASTLIYSILFLLCAFFLNLVLSKYRFSRKYKFPNAVLGWPLLGNTFDVPYPPGMWNAGLAKIYGEM